MVDAHGRGGHKRVWLEDRFVLKKRLRTTCNASVASERALDLQANETSQVAVRGDYCKAVVS